MESRRRVNSTVRHRHINKSLDGLMTLLVAVKTEDQIILAADRKSVWKPNSPPETKCKIAQGGKLFLGIMGLGFYKPANFDVATIARQSMRKEMGFLENILAFNDAIVPAL